MGYVINPSTGKVRYVRKLRKAPVMTKKRMTRLSKLKPLIKKVVRGQEETKYFSTQLALNQTLDGAIHTPGTDQLPLVPRIVQGTGSSQRIGSKITPTKCRVDVCATFSQLNPGITPTDPTINNANEIYVVMYILRSRRLKNWTDYRATTEYQRLLDNGDGTSNPFGSVVSGATTPFWTTDTHYLQQPVEKSAFYQVKKKVVKLVRNQGSMQDGTTGAIPNLPSSAWKGSFTYKLPKLIYDDEPETGGGVEPYPMNSCVFIAFGYALATNYGDANIVGDGAVPQPPALSVTVRNHVWYKDD